MDRFGRFGVAETRRDARALSLRPARRTTGSCPRANLDFPVDFPGKVEKHFATPIGKRHTRAFEHELYSNNSSDDGAVAARSNHRPSCSTSVQERICRFRSSEMESPRARITLRIP